MIKKAFERKGNYYYLLPSYAQAKKIIWDGKDKEGFPFLEHIPKELIDGKPNDSELKIKLRNGSMIQLIGTDNKDSIMGTNPVGCVFSEYSLQDPTAWEYMRPILAENGGWAVFIYTPRGKNHGFDMYEQARNNPDWFCEKLTVNDTKAIPLSVIEDERASGMPEELVRQEYYVSFEAGAVGAYYTQQIERAESEGRIGSVPYIPSFPVDTYWDLGMRDSMAIWFGQRIGGYLRFIDFLECSGESLEYYANELDKRKYNYGIHYFPHDIAVRELGTGKSRLEMMDDLGVRPAEVVPNIGVDDGMNATRMLFNKFTFDQEKCYSGIMHLKQYCKEWDEKHHVWKSHPLHDEHSEAADALRMAAVSFQTSVNATHRASTFFQEPEVDVTDYTPQLASVTERQEESLSQFEAL